MSDSIEDAKGQVRDIIIDRNETNDSLKDNALTAIDNFHEHNMDDIKDYDEPDEDNGKANDNDKNPPGNTGDKSPSLKLSIVSYGSTFGRLEESPGDEHLDFSISDISIPSAKLRKEHTGLNSKLREAVMAEELAPEWLDEITGEVQSKMAEMKRAYEKDHSAPTTLVVGLACGRGKHRSVTFAEKLPEKLATNGWSVTVHHRDVSLNAAQAGSDEEDGSSSLSTQSFDRKGMEKKNKDMREETRNRISIEGDDATSSNLNTENGGSLDREGNEPTALGWEK
ncbi:hypothetical protein EDD36DRAFT_463721 [Exophiala viscosa]|uniref:RapZ C-terminal domain-containing protein n=1 Tax=Exophiala viscosa TaxID=2486360 RepID=A0AAN6IE83_9EURO|nr:hypothetical protein EDD36DRAFT_463721 [Exophiala viscosa]